MDVCWKIIYTSIFHLHQTELIRINNKAAEHVAQQFKNCWLSRYPWLTKAIHDNGANSICERMHQTVGNVLQTIFHGTNVTSTEQAHQFIDNSLYTAMHAIRATTSRVLNNNLPGPLYSIDTSFSTLDPKQISLYSEIWEKKNAYNLYRTKQEKMELWL